jgi:integrase
MRRAVVSFELYKTAGRLYFRRRAVAIKTCSDVPVETPEIRSARDIDAGKTFYIGRRGTGKTAITFFLREKYPKNTLILLPKLLSSADAFVSSDWDQRVRQKPFNTLVSSFVRAILDEAVAEWRRQGLFTFRSADGSEITRKRNNIEQFEFDLRLLNFIDEGFGYLKTGNSKDWLRFRNRPEKIAGEISAECGGQTRLQQFILIDRLDHTFGSLLLQNGASIVYVKEKMGHSSIQVTVDTNGHLIPRRKRVLRRPTG